MVEHNKNHRELHGNSTQHPQDENSGDKAAGMPASVDQSGQEMEDTMNQAELPLRQSLEDLVVVKDLDTGRAIKVLKVGSHEQLHLQLLL